MSYGGSQTGAGSEPEIAAAMQTLIETLTAELNSLRAAADLDDFEGAMTQLHRYLGFYHVTHVPQYQNCHQHASRLEDGPQLEEMKETGWNTALQLFVGLTQQRIHIGALYQRAEKGYRRSNAYYNDRGAKSSFAVEQQLASALQDIFSLTGKHYACLWSGMGEPPKLNTEDLHQAGRWRHYDKTKADFDVASWMARRKSSLGLESGTTRFGVNWEGSSWEDIHPSSMGDGNWSEDDESRLAPNGTVFGAYDRNWGRRNNATPPWPQPKLKPQPEPKPKPKPHPFTGFFGSSKPTQQSKEDQEEYERLKKKFTEGAKAHQNNFRPTSSGNRGSHSQQQHRQQEPRQEPPKPKPTSSPSSQPSTSTSPTRHIITPASVAAWREAGQLVLQNRHAELVSFPDPPPYTCAEKSCELSLAARAIKHTCPHGIRKAFSMVVGLNAKTERTKWHPDRFQANVEMRDGWRLRATEVFNEVQRIYEKN